ncbi:hypothetical protein [Desulfosediminicola ganghwensis]|uniref:hypothetical protein n=1 Tax=Desulfosediminicola ganghwensis TaxID=2569540 RepID=UPI00129487C1|nr:hypothetical protein [Desulfosediminicola ganghwensis]
MSETDVLKRSFQRAALYFVVGLFACGSVGVQGNNLFTEYINSMSGQVFCQVG